MDALAHASGRNSHVGWTRADLPPRQSLCADARLERAAVLTFCPWPTKRQDQASARFGSCQFGRGKWQVYPAG